MDKLLFKRIIIGLLSILIISYIVFIITEANFSKIVDTEQATMTTVSDEIYSKGFIIREEDYITNDVSGVVSYNVEDGETVSAGMNVADIYNNENDAVKRQKIKQLSSQIKSLEDLSESYYKESVSLATVNSQIESNLYSILSLKNSGDFKSAKDASHDLLLSISQRQMITGKVKNFSSKIAQLRKTKKELESSCGDRKDYVTSSKAGYFIAHTDGYENSFDIKNLSKITTGDLSKPKKSSVPKNALGKVVTNPDWYIACKISADNALSLTKVYNLNLTVNVKMPSVTTDLIPAKIYSINQKSKTDDAVLVLSCDYMNNLISSARNEDIELTTISYEGLKVPKRAIHDGEVTKTKTDGNGNTKTSKKKVQGVYVLRGSELIFKQISITYATSNYVLCDPEPEEGSLFNGETIQLYDQVVIKGDNLYDGKVIR